MVNYRLVIGLAGMPGSGKSVVVDEAKESGYGVVGMGDIVREETAKRGLEPTPQNLGSIMLDLRDKEGDSVIARRCIPVIANSKETKVLVDGIRSLAEAELFKAHFPRFTLLAVHASPETRFTRLYNRPRSDRPRDWRVFHKRDLRELAVGLGSAIAMSEYIMMNEGKPEIAKREARKVLRKVEKKWKE